MEFYQQLGESLKGARTKANVSQDALAQSMGLSRVTIANIEKGRQKVHLHNLVEAANFLNVEIGDLIPTQFQEQKLENELMSKISRKFTDQLKANSVQDFVRATLSNVKKT